MLAEQIKAQRILDIQREGLVDWDKVKKSRMTLTKWMDDFVKYTSLAINKSAITAIILLVLSFLK